MRRTLKRTTVFGLRSRGYRCRLERLESRSMMAADIVDAAVDVVPDELTVDDQAEPQPADVLDPGAAFDLQVCDLRAYDFVDPSFAVDPSFSVDPTNVDPTNVDPTYAVDPSFGDDSCLMVTDSVFPAFEPTDIRVQFVSSESASSWAAYYYTVGADGVVQGVSAVASYDDPTIAAFVAEHADDPSFQISDYGDGWWIGGFPLELAPPVPDAVPVYAFCGGGLAAADDSSIIGKPVEWDGSSPAGGWSWDDSSGTYTWIDGTDGGVDWTVSQDWTSSRDDWGTVYDWSGDGSGFVCTLGGSWDQNTDAGGDWTSTWDGSGVVEDTGWSWNDWMCGDFSESPLFYARGAIESGGFVCGLSPADPSSAAADGAGAGEMQAGDESVAEPVAANPRAAAFADMGAMAAAATALQAGSTDTPPIGGRRRR